MLLKAILVGLLVPPFGFMTLAIAGLILTRFRLRAGLRLMTLALTGLLILAIPAVPAFMIEALERDLPRTVDPKAPPGAIVVLGAEIRQTLDPPHVVIGTMSLERLRTAAALQRQTGLPILVSGGVLQHGAPSIAEIMARSLTEDFLVPVRWQETRSLDTWENARFSAEILRAQGITSVYVVTHAWHMRRSLLAFRDTGLTVVAAPTPPGLRMGPVLEDFVPHQSVWGASYFALHELIGYAWYTIR